jgi:hypothetical protein
MAIKGNIKACPTAQIFNAVLSFGPAVSNPYATAQSMHPNMRENICHHHHRERWFKKKRAFLMSHLFSNACKKKKLTNATAPSVFKKYGIMPFGP